METAHLSIAALAQETGIAKDTLRVWERRYGFPQPLRSERGRRQYPAQQVARLRQVRRLLDQGLRPGQALRLSAEALAQAAAPATPTEPALLELLKRHDDAALRQALRARLRREGLRHFVGHSAPAMLAAVGDGWAGGQIEVFEEHHFSTLLEAVLREALAQLPPAGGPQVLLSTLPGEPHTLGLLLALAALRLEGAAGVWLGAQTPPSQIVAAAQAFGVQAVALSFSAYLDPGAVRRGVTQLRQRLAPDIALWCGGQAAARLKRPPDGVTLLRDLGQLAQRLQALAAGRA